MQKEAGPWARKHLYDGRALVIVALRHGSDVTLSQEWPIQPRASEETKRRQGLAPHCSARVSSSGHLLNFERRIPHASRCGKMNRALQQCPRPPLVGCHLPRSRIFGSSPSSRCARNLVVPLSPMPTSWRLIPFPGMGHLGPKHRSPECARGRTRRM